MTMWTRFLSLFAIAAALAGCQPKAVATAEEPSDGAVASSPRGPDESAPAGSGGGVAPIGSGVAGGMTPMSGTESVQGGGSSAGQVAKDRARGLANSSPSSLNSAGDEGN